MAVFNGMMPILPGKEEAAQSWLAAIAGPRKDEFDAMQRRSDIVRETVTIQRTPMGAFLLIWFEGDIAKAFEVVATGEDAFTAWHRAQLHDVTGIDVRTPDSSPPPATVVDWRA